MNSSDFNQVDSSYIFLLSCRTWCSLFSFFIFCFQRPGF